MDVNSAFNKFRKQASMKKEALLAGGLSYLNRSNEDPKSFGDNVIRSILTEAGADVGGFSGAMAASVNMPEAWLSKISKGSSNKATLLANLALALAGLGGYGLGGYATHKLTKNKSK